MPSLVTHAEADSSDQELRELHEELLQQVCACQKCCVQLLSGAACRSLPGRQLTTQMEPVQIAERKKLHQNLMKRLKKEPALATVSQPDLKLWFALPTALAHRPISLPHLPNLIHYCDILHCYRHIAGR